MTRISSCHLNTHTRQIHNNEKEYSLQKEVYKLTTRFFKYMCNNPGALITTTLACVARTIEAAPLRIDQVRSDRLSDSPLTNASSSSLLPESQMELVYGIDHPRLCALLSMEEPEFVRDVLKFDCDQYRPPQKKTLTQSITTSSGVLLVQPYDHPISENLTMCALLPIEQQKWARDVLQLECDSVLLRNDRIVLWESLCAKSSIDDRISPFEYLKMCMENICVIPEQNLRKFKSIIDDWCITRDPATFIKIFNKFNEYLQSNPIITVPEITTEESIKKEIQSSIGLVASVLSVVASAISVGAGYLSYKVAKVTQGAVTAVGMILPKSLTTGMQLLAENTAGIALGAVQPVQDIVSNLQTVGQASSGASLYFDAMGEVLNTAVNKALDTTMKKSLSTALGSAVLGSGIASGFPEGHSKPLRTVVCILNEKKMCKYINPEKNHIQPDVHRDWWDMICLLYDDQIWCKFGISSTNPSDSTFIRDDNSDEVCQSTTSGGIWCNLGMLSDGTVNLMRKFFGDEVDEVKGQILNIEAIILEQMNNATWKISMFHQ